MFKKIEAIIREEKLNDVKDALSRIGIVGLNVVEIRGHGRDGGVVLTGRTGTYKIDLLPRVQVIEAALLGAEVELLPGGPFADRQAFRHVHSALRIAEHALGGDLPHPGMPATTAAHLYHSERAEQVREQDPDEEEGQDEDQQPGEPDHLRRNPPPGEP